MNLALQGKATVSIYIDVRWRTIFRFVPHEWETIDQVVRLLAPLGRMIFRVVIDNSVQDEFARFVDDKWIVMPVNEGEKVLP